MATICNIGVSAGTTNGSGTGQAYIDYSISDQADRVVITSKMVVASTLNYGYNSLQAIASLWYNSSWTVYTSTYPSNSTTTRATSTSRGVKVTKDASASQTTTIYKTHSAQTVNVTAYYYILEILVPDFRGSTTGNNSNELRQKTIVEALPTISARTSYTLTFNANGGTGGPLTQTKWHNESFTIPSTTPTLENYRFIGWATSVARASAGTVDYTVGSVYPAATNGDAILYAVWELPYTKPSLTDVSVERCLQNGNPHDEGEYALITFNWSIYRSSLPRYYGGTDAPYTNNAIKTNGCSATVGSKTASKTPTGTSKLKDTLVVGGGFSTDVPYTAVLTLEDTQTAISDHVATYNGVLSTTYFPMDFNKDATSVGFFRPAPNDEQGAFFGKDIIANNDIYFTLATGSAGTDYEIQQSLTALNWTDDVIV